MTSPHSTRPERTEDRATTPSGRGSIAAALGTLLAVLGFANAHAAAPAEPPSVVLFVVDDVADSDFDAIRTPTFDALAERGARFRRAYAHAWCSATRDSLLFSAWNGLERGKDCDAAVARTRPDDTLTIAKLFQANGYTTAHLGKWHLGPTVGGGWRDAAAIRGFDRVLCGMPVGVCETPPPLGEGIQGWPRLDDGEVSWGTGPRTAALRDALRGWWRTTDGPKFAMVHFRAAHAPFQRPDDALLPDWARELPSRSRRQRFELEVIAVDHAVGALLPDLGEDTLVLFLSDNGTPGGKRDKEVATRRDQDRYRVKGSCYEDGVRVPFVLAGAGVPQGRSVDAPVHVVDLLPTLAELTGLSVETPIDGASFAPVLRDAPPARDWVYVHQVPMGPKAIVEERWKLLVHRDGRRELFDLVEDPAEAHPLPAEGANAERLAATLVTIEAAGDSIGATASSTTETEGER